MSYPTDPPVSERILDHIKSTLEAIATPSYSMTVKGVWRISDQLALREFPSCVISPPTIEWDDTTNSIKRGFMRVSVRTVIENREDWPQALAFAMTDVRKALLADWTRGGWARDTHAVSEDHIPLDYESGLSAGDVSLLISFSHADSDPSLVLPP